MQFNIQDFTVRPLDTHDIEQVRILDKISTFCVADNLDVTEYAYGLFYEPTSELIGYCTIGGADCYEDLSENLDDLLLSDMFINNMWTGKKLGHHLMQQAILQRLPSEPYADHLYILPLYDSLSAYYEDFGFTKVPDEQDFLMLSLHDYAKKHQPKRYVEKIRDDLYYVHIQGHDTKTVTPSDDWFSVIRRMYELEAHETPYELPYQDWSPAVCPNCDHVFSTCIGDGVYSHPTFMERCPICGQCVSWIHYRP